MTARSLDIGSLRCRVVAEEARYPRMLAGWYGDPLVESASATEPSVDLEVRFTEDRRAPAPETDRLVVEETATGHRLTTDPLTCALDLDGPWPEALMTVTDPGMDPDDLSLHIWLVTNQVLLLLERLVLHAAGVVVNGRVAVLCGESGVGKSTLAAALGASGATLLSEDKVLVRRRGSGFSASGISSRMRITASTEQHLLAGRLDAFEISTDGKQKRTFPAGHVFRADPHRDHPLDHLFLLSVGDHVDVRPVSKRDALVQLLDNTKWTVRFDSPLTYRRYLDLVGDVAASVPAHRLQRGSELGDLDELVTAVRAATRG